MTFTQAKEKFDQEFGMTSEYSCFLPEHLSIGKTVQLRKKDGSKNEQYYKWQFLYSIVNSGLFPKDLIGTEVHFPKGNKDAANIKIDAAVFADASWWDKYVDYHTNKNDNIELSIFVKLFLDYLADRGIIDCVKVGGHGGSFAQKYWSIIPFPKFRTSIMKEITTKYHSQRIYCAKDLLLDEFAEYDHSYNAMVGIYELDKSAKYLRRLLNRAIDDIVNDRDVQITFEI